MDKDAKKEEAQEEEVVEEEIKEISIFSRFEEIEDNALLYVMERWGINEVNQDEPIIVQGKVEWITTSITLRRDAPGGSQYQWNEARQPFRFVPENQKLDIIVEHPVAEIHGAGGDIGILTQVLKQLGRAAAVAAHEVIVEMNQRYYVSNEGKPQMRQMGRKEVAQDLKDTADRIKETAKKIKETAAEEF